MHDAAGMGAMTMDGTMQSPGGRVGGILAVHCRRVIGIQQQEVTGPDPGKVTLIRIHQELRPLIIDGQTEMIGNSLMQVVTHGPPERAGHIHPFLVMLDILLAGRNTGYRHDYPPLISDF